MCHLQLSTIHCKICTCDTASAKYLCRFPGSLSSNTLSYAQSWAGNIWCCHPSQQHTQAVQHMSRNSCPGQLSLQPTQNQLSLAPMKSAECPARVDLN